VRAGAPLALHASLVDGHRITRSIVGAHAGPVEEGPQSGPADDPIQTSNATIRSFACQEDCRVILVVSGGGRVGLEGNASGRLATLPLGERFCSRECTGEDAFRRDEPTGALVAGPALLGGSPHLLASGRVTLFLKGASAIVETARGNESLDATTSRDPAVAPLPPVVYQGVDRHAWLNLTGASVLQGTGPAELLAEKAELDLQGALASPDASGTLDYAGNQTSFRHQPIRLEGALLLDATRSPSAGAPATDALGGAPLASGVRGDATLVRVGDHETRAAPGASASSAALAARIGLGGAILAALVLLARALLVPLYSRIAPANALANANRARIHALLSDSPGQCPADVSRATGIARVVVRHHLAVLEAQRLIVSRRVEGRLLYLPARRSLDPETLRAKAQLKSGTRRRLAEVVGAAPEGLTQGDIIARTGLPRRLVAYHLRRLGGLGLVEHDGGAPRRYRSSLRLAATLAGPQGSPAGAAPAGP
jgi:predicted transcriptional regulator